MDSKRQSRIDFLADVAEMYYIDRMNQWEIADRIGVTRSMVSRMITEARDLGLVKIQIERPFNLNYELSQLMKTKYNLLQAAIVEVPAGEPLLVNLGRIGARLLEKRIQANAIIGTSWGTAISATVSEMNPPYPLPGIKIVQLLGAMGARVKEYDGISIVRRLEQKLNAEGVYLNAPFLVDSNETAAALYKARSIQETVHYGNQANVALLGVGSTRADVSPYTLAGYISESDLNQVQEHGAVGDICGIFFTQDGSVAFPEFQKRIMGLSIDSLLRIPSRIAVAGGASKVKPILGALRGGLINILVTDTSTAQAILSLDAG